MSTAVRTATGRSSIATPTPLPPDVPPSPRRERRVLASWRRPAGRGLGGAVVEVPQRLVQGDELVSGPRSASPAPATSPSPPVTARTARWAVVARRRWPPPARGSPWGPLDIPLGRPPPRR